MSFRRYVIYWFISVIVVYGALWLLARHFLAMYGF